MLCSYASMEKEHLDNLQGLEKDIGAVLLAFSCKAVKPAQLTPEQLEKIKNLEKELGVVIVAV